MTDSQVKYQTLMENQRHNLAMEKLGSTEMDLKATETKFKERVADADVWLKHQQGYHLGFEDSKLVTDQFLDGVRVMNDIAKTVIKGFSLFA